jgi:hypothetical protein
MLFIMKVVVIAFEGLWLRSRFAFTEAMNPLRRYAVMV